MTHALNFLNNDWRRPGCGNTCHIKYVFLPGLAGREPLEMHDPEAHEAWGAIHSDKLDVRTIVETGPLRIDLYAREVTVNGVAVSIAMGEWDLLSILARNIGRRFSSRELVVLLRGPEFNNDAGLKLLRMVIWRLRHHLLEARVLLNSTSHGGYSLLSRPVSLSLAPCPNRWASKYDACVECGRTTNAHHSVGLCGSCWWKLGKQRKQAAECAS